MTNIRKLNRYVKYSLKALSEKLREMEYERTRYSKGNVWNVDVMRLKLAIIGDKIESRTEEETTMSSSNTKPTQVDSFKIKVKNKTHPNDSKYAERTTFESQSAWSKLLLLCSPEQQDQLLSGELLLEPEDTAKFIEETQEGDVIGYGQAREGHVFYTGKMSVIANAGDCLVGEDMTKQKNTILLRKSEVSIAMATGFLEVLYRDGKPFGIPEESEVEVKIHKMQPEAEDASTETASEAKTATEEK